MGDKLGARHNGIAKRSAIRSARYEGKLTLQQAMAIETEDDGDDLFAEDGNDLVDVPQRALRSLDME